jgi:hypothetical protein
VVGVGLLAQDYPAQGGHQFLPIPGLKTLPVDSNFDGLIYIVFSRRHEGIPESVRGKASIGR